MIVWRSETGRHRGEAGQEALATRCPNLGAGAWREGRGRSSAGPSRPRDSDLSFSREQVRFVTKGAVAGGATLELAQHGFCVAHLELAGLFEIQSLDDPILDEHGVAHRADTHATCGQILVESESLGIGRAAVGHHADLARGLLRLPPRTHHEGIVDRQAPHLVHALGPELVMVRDVTGHVLGRTRRSKRARQAEDDDAFTFGELGKVEGVWPDRAPGRLVLDQFGQGSLW